MDINYVVINDKQPCLCVRFLRKLLVRDVECSPMHDSSNWMKSIIWNSLSFNEESFLYQLKHAIVRLRLKKPSWDPFDVKSHRPISNLSFISKLVERFVTNLLQLQAGIYKVSNSAVGMQTASLDWNRCRHCPRRYCQSACVVKPLEVVRVFLNSELNMRAHI